MTTAENAPGGEQRKPASVGEHFFPKIFAMLDTKVPQPRFKKLLDEGGFAELGPELVMSFDRPTTEFVLRNSDVFSTRIEMNIGNARPLTPLNVDPPQHKMYRKLLDPMFSPRKMDAQVEDITRRVNDLIDGFIDRGECDFTNEFAEIFPSSVFLGLCGLPEEELRMFLHMRDGIMHPELLDPLALTDPERSAAVNRATGVEIYDYFGGLIDERIKSPTDDMISGFLTHEIDGKRLTKEDILDVCFNFLVAGLDTVTSSLTVFFAFLAQNPEHRRQIVERPEDIPAAVEELLRWETPVPSGIPRVATRDVELPNGRTIKAGTGIVISFGAANVSEDVWPDPFTVRFDRESNPHLAFAGGAHRCLGSHLARRELRIALREWHRRIPEYTIKPGHEELEYPPGIRHVRNLWLSWK